MAYCTKRDRESGGRDPYVTGLGAALQECPGIPPAERQRPDALKQAGLRLLAPEKGGRHAVWVDRPLALALVGYAAADVVTRMVNTRVLLQNLRSTPG